MNLKHFCTISLMLSGIAQVARSYIRIKGPEASKFLNGLITTRLLPNVVKKKQHTISASENRHLELLNVDLSKNWGLMHEDIYDPENRIWIRRDGLNSMILNSKGRVVQDCFLYATPFHSPVPPEPSYLVEVDPKYKSQMLSLFKIHRLSADVKIEDASSMSSYYYFNDTPEFEDFLEELQSTYFDTFDTDSALQNANEFISREEIFDSSAASNIVGFAFDNRIPNFGLKVVTTQPVDPLLLFSQQFMDKFPVEVTDEKAITQRRFANGLFEYGDAPKGTSLLPFEMNLDYVNGLSLDKGCYVGQELTIRTFNGGVIRKRIFPVHLACGKDVSGVFSGVDLNEVSIAYENESEMAQPATVGSSPFASTGKVGRRGKVAKLLAVEENLGFLLASVDDVQQGKTFQCVVGDTTVLIRPSIPEWWPE